MTVSIQDVMSTSAGAASSLLEDLLKKSSAAVQEKVAQANDSVTAVTKPVKVLGMQDMLRQGELAISENMNQLDKLVKVITSTQQAQK